MYIILILLIVIILLAYRIGGSDVDEFYIRVQHSAHIIVPRSTPHSVISKYKSLQISHRVGDEMYPIYYNIKPTENFSYAWINGKIITPSVKSYHSTTLINIPQNDTMNPPVIVQSYEGYNVVMDNLLCGGSKQRALWAYFNDMKIKPKDIIYAGPAQGAAQVALGCVAKYFGVRAHMFSSGKHTELTSRAKSLGVKIYDHHTLKDAQAGAHKLCESLGANMISFGLMDTKYKSYLVGALRNACKGIHPRRMWVAVGSAALLNALYEVFPTTYFFGIVVGRTVWWDQIDPSRTCIIECDIPFTENARIQPPYQTVPSYDAKVWEYVQRWGKKGDYIWNVYGYDADVSDHRVDYTKSYIHSLKSHYERKK